MQADRKYELPEGRAHADWPEDYAALGIQRDTWACAAKGSRAEAEALVFALVAEGRQVRLARDPDDPEVWHLALRGGAAGADGGALFVANIRGGEVMQSITCDVAMGPGTGQHPQGSNPTPKEVDQAFGTSQPTPSSAQQAVLDAAKALADAETLRAESAWTETLRERVEALREEEEWR